jgi:Predicted membrane-associated Zn-dependent proteases 1
MSVVGIIITILLFALIIFLHELGHFIAAKLSGIKVNEFALGMGPKIIKKQGKETLYSLRPLPIGGFCAMEGEDEDNPDPRAFGNAKLRKRFIVILAGAFMNLVLGVVICSIMVGVAGFVVSPEVAEVSGDDVYSAGLRVGDVITRLDGKGFGSANEFFFSLSQKTEPVTLTYKRGGESFITEKIELNNDQDYGFKMKAVKANVFTAVSNGFKDSVFYGKAVYLTLGQMITGKVSVKDVSGPVGVADAVGTVVATSETPKETTLNVLNMFALLTINVGLFNLLPFPALDGGRFWFLVYEGIRKKKAPQKVEQYVNAAGMILLLGLMAVIFVKDIVFLFLK